MNVHTRFQTPHEQKVTLGDWNIQLTIYTFTLIKVLKDCLNLLKKCDFKQAAKTSKQSIQIHIEMLCG